MIGVGIIGAGYIGAVHARAIALLPGIRLVASCRTDVAAGAAFARDHGDVWTAVPESTEADWAFRAIGRQWEDLAATLRCEAELPVTGAQGRHVIAVIEAAMRAARSGCEEAI